jgi:hypothetical protein
MVKCWPEFFEAIKDGRKTHDLRRNDRDFKVGDRLLLAEFDPKINCFMDQELMAEITYITSADVPCALSAGALNAGYCILSIRCLGDIFNAND